MIQYNPIRNRMSCMPQGELNPKIFIGSEEPWKYKNKNFDQLKTIPFHELHCPVCFRRMELTSIATPHAGDPFDWETDNAFVLEYACNECRLTTRVSINPNRSHLQLRNAKNNPITSPIR